ncbi:hypothetical protein AV530_014075 [Patagioenas fasciata monilis]|uniref:Rho-GAP domain-containing protein n=1 Tax=Patagioenas fasciata monilis TaxID=372326 RepID=A0A1V4K5E1_PATFA|nr:hypothetical protein AV530_014075 [Patagioenas fasciata monilis]
MSSNNLAICIGPNLLRPPNKKLLLLEVMLEVKRRYAHQNLAADSSLDAFSSLKQTLVRVAAPQPSAQRPGSGA